MGWDDGLALLDQSWHTKTDWTDWQKQQQRQSTMRLANAQPYSPYRAGVSSGVRSSIRTTAQPTQYQPAGFPEKIEFSVPYSVNSQQPRPPQQDTRGDFFASLGASWDNAVGKGGYLNLANAIPWGMERMGVLAGEAATGLTSDDHNIVNDALDFIGQGMAAVAEPVAKAIEWFPNTLRDTMLNQRAMTYKALVKGESIGPLESLVSTMLSFTGLNDANLTTKGMAAGQLTPEVRRFLAESIDLPASVKRALDANPDADAAKALDSADEGRMWTYTPGVVGAGVNIGSTLLAYGIELALTGGVAGMAAGAGAASTVPGVAMGTRALVTGARAAATIQKTFLATGLGYFGLSTMFDTVARMQGDQAAVAWFDRVNRSSIISDDPSIQLVTSFTVDPIGAAKMAGLGKPFGVLGKGVTATFDKVTGGRFARVYTQEDRVRDIVAKMYGTTREGADQFVGPTGAYESWAAATDRIVELAWDHVANSLTFIERAKLGAITDAAERTKVVLEQYGQKVVDTIEHHPEAIVARLRRDWEYHDFQGPWDPHVAALIERDYMAAKLASVQARQATDSVVGYVEYLNPEGQARFASEIDQLFSSGKPVTLRDLNTLNGRYPATRKLYRDLVVGKKADDVLDRGTFDTVLQRASDRFAEASKTNPRRVATGTDPVIRPSSPRRLDEYAEALGTNADTISAIERGAGSWGQAEHDLVVAFAREKGIVGDAELASLSKDQLWEKASEYVDQTTAPWRKRGEEVEHLERQIAQTDDAIRELTQRPIRDAQGRTTLLATHVRPEDVTELNRLQAERSALANLLADVKEPIVPFTQGVRFASRDRVNQEVVAQATRKLEAEQTLTMVREIDMTVDAWNTISSRSPLAMIRRSREGVWSWAGTAPAMSDSIFDKLHSFLIEYGGPRGIELAKSMSEMGDEELWRLAAKYRDAAAFRRGLTGNQRKVVDRATVSVKSSLDEYKGAWQRNTGQHPNVGDDEFLAELGRLRDARDDLLAGRSEYHLGRSASSKVPDWALDEAQKGMDRPDLLTGAYDDPEYVVSNELARQSLSRALDSEDTFPAAQAIIEGDPLLRAQADRIAFDRGATLDELLADPGNREVLRGLVGALPEEPIVPGVPRALTELDQAVLSGDTGALVSLRDELATLRGRPAPPLRDVPQDAAEALARKPRPSVEISADMRDAGVGWHDPIPADAWVKHEAGAKVASLILHGDMAHPPRTPASLLTVLREIENGNAANIGIGADLAAEAQRAAKSILGRMVGDAKRANFDAGVVGMGRGLNPYRWGEDTYELMRDLLGKKEGRVPLIVVRDDGMGIQYGLKARPEDAVVLEMSRVPGLAEELLTGYMKPWSDRIGAAQVRWLYNQTFGPRHNQEIAFAARGRLMDALAERGVPADLASRIWRAWKEKTVESRGIAQEKTRGGALRFRSGDNALYASERNIPNAELNAIAYKEAEAYFGAAMPENIASRTLDFSEEFRLATSWTRRNLKEVPKLGDLLADAYGVVMHNKAVTTLYYWFRFGLDIRFHALNAMEGPFLYAGRAALRPGSRLIEGDRGLFGYTREYLTRMARDGLNDTGYPFSHDRMAWAYRTFLKEQPDKLRGLLAEDPALMEDALRSLAKHDPELSATIKAMGDTPDAWLKALDQHYRKIMDSVDPAAVASAEVMKDAIADPALAELYGRLAQVNEELWGSVRNTFYGNPARSNVERWMNHYLLYWPISYQIKATKWLAKVLLDRAGGLKTNAAGAYGLDQLATYHSQLMQNDPDYAEFIQEHPTLLFAAQMLLPMSPDSIGVSLSPFTRDLAFGASKQVGGIGPVYTITKFVPDLAGELYKDFDSLPGMDAAYRMFVGRKPPNDYGN